MGVCCNYKVAAITVAVITIVFSGLNLAKVSFSAISHGYHHEHHHGRHHEHHHGHHHGHHNHTHDEKEDDVKLPFEMEERDESEDEGKRDENNEYSREGDMLIKKKKGDHHKEENEGHENLSYFRVGRIVSIVADIISIVTSCLIFAAVSNDVDKNQRRRHLILPFIVWHLLCIVLLFIGCIVVAIVFKDYMSHLAIPLLIGGVAICILILFVGLVMKYFGSLAVGAAGFTYDQMDDGKDEIKKQPLV